MVSKTNRPVRATQVRILLPPLDNLLEFCNNYYMNQLLFEDFTSVQKVQAGVSKILKRAQKAGKFVRILRNNQPVGVLVPNNVWESYLEDLEALSSENYLKRIAKSRSDKVRYSSTQVKKMLGID